jgi:uncharacterized surface protein with fasciclin (FAS1) repeats
MKNKVLFTLLLALSLLLASHVPAQAHTEGTMVRIGHFVKDGPLADVWVDGKSVVTMLPPGAATSYMPIAAGAHKLTIVPNGASMDKAIVGPLDLTITDDHTYTIAVVGQADDASLKPLIIDETAAYKDVDGSKDVPTILINNLAGVSGIDTKLEGELVGESLPYEAYVTATIPVGNYHKMGVEITAAGDPKTVILPSLGPGAFFAEPNTNYLVVLMGKQGQIGVDYYPVIINHTDLNAIDFLAGFSGRSLGWGKDAHVRFIPQTFEFDTFLTALDKAGLKDMLATKGPYVIFAPTNEAFAAVDKATLDKLMADPAALARVLRYHLVEGMLTEGDLMAEKALTTIEGSQLTIAPMGEPGEELFGINGNEAGCGCNYNVANGSRIFVVDRVLMPKD